MANLSIDLGSIDNNRKLLSRLADIIVGGEIYDSDNPVNMPYLSTDWSF